MSKILYVQFRDSKDCNPSCEKKVEEIIRRISADNIRSRPAKVVMNGNTIYGISNVSNTIIEKDKSVLLGLAYEQEGNWWEPGGQIPDGSYSIYRSNENCTEILSDVAASRTIWYYHDRDLFAASSSQRAIISFIGKFTLNRRVIPWILSTGSLGPELSWDSSIKMLPPDSCACLDYESWKLELKSAEVIFHSEDLPDKEHEANLLAALRDTFKNIPLDFKSWVLPLSGGYDSRGILCLLHDAGCQISSLKSLTWGLANAIRKPGNDAYVAKRVAEYFNINHTYYITDKGTEPLERVFSRFILCGEGRIDHIGGYLDGFKIWADLFNDNIQGIIRGDEGFGINNVTAPANIRYRVSISLCTDFPNLATYEDFGLPKQEMPESLQKKEDESIDTWRDRLYHQFRMPVILSALTDLKLPFTEVINPLLSRRILYQARKLPDHLRTEKNAYRKIVKSLSPKIKFATSKANEGLNFSVKSEKAVEIMERELTSAPCRDIIPDKLLNYILGNLKCTTDKTNRKANIKAFIKRFLPAWLMRKVRDQAVNNNLEVNVIAFRVYMISRMNQILKQDASFSKEFDQWQVDESASF
jgi:hypothetical protein